MDSVTVCPVLPVSCVLQLGLTKTVYTQTQTAGQVRSNGQTLAEWEIGTGGTGEQVSISSQGQMQDWQIFLNFVQRFVLTQYFPAFSESIIAQQYLVTLDLFLQAQVYKH